MGVSTFVKGALLEIEERPFKLLRKIDKDLWQLEDERTGKIIQETISDLLGKYDSGQLVFINDSYGNGVSSRAQELAERKKYNVSVIEADGTKLDRIRMMRAYIKAVEHLPVYEKSMSEEISKTWVKLGSLGTPPHWITVARWKRKYSTYGNDAYSLLPRSYLKGNRIPRYCTQVTLIAQQAIDAVYLTRERNTVQDTLDSAIAKVERENKMLPLGAQLAIPTRRMLQSLINEIDMFDRYAARYGQQAAVKKYRSVLHMNVASYPLECAEIDHTKLDMIVVDENSGLPLGRPWVTVCIDKFTRCILGIYVGFEPPSYLSVARCLKHAFRPKVGIKEIYSEIDNEWFSFGVMMKLIVDNGLEFHSESLEKVCLAFGIDLQFTPRKTPWWKGVVERFIGTMNRGVAHGKPGTTFSNIFEKDDYDPVKHAVISYDRLKLILNKWVVDVYHQRPHRSLDNISPALTWSSSINIDEISLPDNLENIDALLGASVERVLTHKGIEYEKLFFNSAELGNLRRRLGDKLNVSIRVDEGNLGRIFVIAPDGSEIIEAPCLDIAYADGLSLWQHKVCRRHAAIHLDMGSNSNAWRQAKEDIRAIVQEEILSGKKRTKARAKRFNGDTASNNSTSDKSTNTSNTSSKEEVAPASEPTSPVLNVFETLPTQPVKKFKALIEDRREHK